MSSSTRRGPEADLAFLRSIVEGGSGGRGTLTMGVSYLAGGLLYGLQCLFHIAQSAGALVLPGAVTLLFLAAITLTFLGVLAWAVREDRKVGPAAPMVTRTLNAAFSGAGMANLAIIIVFGVGAARDGDFSIWLYYPAMIFALQAAAWYVAWTLRRKGWMLATALGGWLTAVGLGLLVRQPEAYLWLCTAALLLLFAAPGWIMVRAARQARTGV